MNINLWKAACQGGWVGADVLILEKEIKEYSAIDVKPNDNISFDISCFRIL